jgi:hypothetical protein
MRWSTAKRTKLWTQAAKLGSSRAHCQLGLCYKGDLKKAKFHFEFAMAGHEVAREIMGLMEGILEIWNVLSSIAWNEL